MTTLQQLKDYLHGLLYNPEIQDYCPNGLQVEGKGAVSKVATAVTASLATIEAAVEQGVDALVVHHGLFWKGDSYVVTGPKRERLALLLNNEMSLFGYHLPLDAHRRVGNNWKAAEELGWRELEPFGLMGSSYIGVKGRFDPISRKTLQSQLEDYYQHPAAVALGGPEEVTSAGLISGGAYRQIPDAAVEGLDCFITGNVDEPAWHLAHENEVNFYSLGHTATERVGPIALAEVIEKDLGVETIFLDLENPF